MPSSGAETPEGSMHPDRAALSLALRRICDGAVIAAVAGADNGFGSDANANCLRRVLAQAHIPAEPPFEFVEALSLAQYDEPDGRDRRPRDGDRQRGHAARALATSTLLLLAGDANADVGDLVTEATLARLVNSLVELDAETRRAGIRTLDWVSRNEAHFGALSAHAAVGVVALARSADRIDDDVFAGACLHAAECSERWRRPRHGAWRNGAEVDDDCRSWLDPLLTHLHHVLRIESRHRGFEAQAAADMLALRLLGRPPRTEPAA